MENGFSGLVNENQSKKAIAFFGLETDDDDEWSFCLFLLFQRKKKRKKKFEFFYYFFLALSGFLLPSPTTLSVSLLFVRRKRRDCERTGFFSFVRCGIRPFDSWSSCPLVEQETALFGHSRLSPCERGTRFSMTKMAQLST